MTPVELAAGGLTRRYLLSAPPAAAGPAPLVLVLHGKGGTAEWADDETGWSALAAREGFALALPDGIPPHPEKPPKFLTNPPRWNDGSEVRNAELGARGDDDRAGEPVAPLPDDVAFLAAVVADATSRTPVDHRRVYLTGFSNGAGMAFRAAAELAGTFAAVAPVAGHCWVADPHPSRPVPTLYVIGTADPLIPLRGGDVRSPWLHRLVRRPPVADTLERWAVAIGCETVPEVVSDAGGVRVERYPGPTEFQAVTVDGLGHHWPGGKGRLDRRIAGPPSAAWDATAGIWGFFRTQVNEAAGP